MFLRQPRFWFTTVSFFSLTAVLAAQPRDTSRVTPTASPRSGAARGPLPDPILLDGSAMEAEKRQEHGMLAEFELPGDENAQGDKVGQTSEQAGGGGAASAQAGGQQQMPQGAASGGGGAQSSDASAQASGGGAAGGQSQPSPAGGAAGSQSAAQGSNNSAEGTQVGQLAGDGSGGATGQNAPPAKPQQIALGDTAMQIKPQGGNAPGVVGAERAQAVGKDVPQQYDARTPGGGQQSGSRSGNQGVEKGRVMPSGI